MKTIRRASLAWLVTLVGGGGFVYAGDEPCPPDAVPEGEPCGFEKNAGCGAGFVFWDAACGETWCGEAWAIGGTRDTDWYGIDVPDPDGDGEQLLRAPMVSDFNGVCYIVDGMEFCTPMIIGQEGAADGGRIIEVAQALVDAPAWYIVFVATAEFEGVECDGGSTTYSLEFDCTVPACAADVDDDGMIGVADLVAVILDWGTCSFAFPCPADVNGDFTVDVQDLTHVVVNWGPCS